MGAVRFISSSIVQAANHWKSSKIELTPFDLRLLPIGHIQKGLLFQKPLQAEKETDHPNTLIHHLETSLSQTLSHFPPLAGRLATIEHEADNTISYFVDCNNAGALFIHAVADEVTISDITKPVYVPHIVHSFFPLNGLKNYEGVSNPLLGIQVTDLVDGIFIGCTMNHAVVDGTSFWHFFNSWSEISRGSFHLSKPPVFQRCFLDAIDLPIRILKSQLEEACRQEFILPSNLQEKVFHFTRETIAKLKAKANAEIGTNNISSLQALQAHIWRTIISIKNFDGDKETNYRIVVGARRRVQDLPESYFGNAMFGWVVTMKAKELLKEGIGNVAWKMNRIIATATEESFKKFLESWPTSPKFVTTDFMTTTNNALVNSSSPRFNMYGNDFGWGKPIAVRSGSANKFDGKITFFCGAQEGNIDIELCLTKETLEPLANDEEFELCNC